MNRNQTCHSERIDDSPDKVHILSEINMNNKLQLAILCGGQSPEHEVSINSTKNVVKALDKNKYHIHVIYITKEGEWFLFASPQLFLDGNNPAELLDAQHGQRVSLILGHNKTPLMTLEGEPKWLALDVVFPVLHGCRGEDGTVQGLLDLANIPYVGPGVLGSAICMDKEVSKRLLREAQIPIADFIALTHAEVANIKFDTIVKKLGLPFFIKPANTGSSVGISKVKHQDDFQHAIDLALQYDYKIIIEEFVAGQEIECAVLGNGSPEASLPGQIIPHHEFYTYEAKYLDPDGAELVVPAPLPDKIRAQVQELAKKAYVTLCCEGMTRVDFFVTTENKVVVNEANTIPGFTQISMYPKMWIASGLNYGALLDKLITLALERFARDHALIKARSEIPELTKKQIAS